MSASKRLVRMQIRTNIKKKMVETNVFRVQIILNNYFNDYRAKSYVSVNRQWKNVRQFHKHLNELFGLERFLLTTGDNIYLPGKTKKKKKF